MLLIEQNFTNIQTISEGATPADKKLYLQGIFMEAESKNINGRIYPKSDIQKAVTKINEAAMSSRHILGELDHPPTLEVKLANVSHKIVEMVMDGNNAIGKAQILESTPMGQIAASLIKDGVNIGVSSRGSGSVNESTHIVEGFDLISVDLVASPSARNAYPTTLREQIEFYNRGEIVTDLAEAVIHDNKAQKYFQTEIFKFIKSNFN